MALRVAGWRAPRVLAGYAQLTILNRTSRGRRINSVPKLLDPRSTPVSRLGGNDVWDADIVVPVYNDFEGLTGLLPALRAEAPAFNSVILVHDYSSDPRIAPLLHQFGAACPNGIVLENDRNLGFLKSCNRGLTLSERDSIILNTDIEVPPGALGRVLSTLRTRGDVATATPFSSNAYGAGFPDLNYDNRRPFGATTAQIDRAFQSMGPLKPIEIPRGVGFCMAISRRAIDRIGVFDECFGEGYGEEADFCLRARKAGFSNLLATDAYVYHKSGQSFGTSSRARARAALVKLLTRHPSYPSLVRDYLNAGRARAVAFAALIELSRILSDREPEEYSEHDGADCPMIRPRLIGGGDPRFMQLRYLCETYEFYFGDFATADEARKLAGLRATSKIT